MKTAALIAAAAVIGAASALAQIFGGDEVEHARATALTVADREVEARHLAAEARIQREVLLARSRP